MLQWTARVRLAVCGLMVLLAGGWGAERAAAAVYQAELAVAAGPAGLAAGDEVTLIVPIERQMYEDLGAGGMQMLNPERVRLTTPEGKDLAITARAVRLVGTESLGGELRFKLDRKVPAHRQVGYVLTFEGVGAEMIRNAPELKAERVESSYTAGDWATAQGGTSWDFDDAAQPTMQGAWHATAKEGVEERYLVATADGKYSSPVLGHLPGPIDGKRYSRVLMRARRVGPTPAALLINGKQRPVNAAGEAMLGEAFEVYSLDLAGRAGWGDEVENLGFRWAHGNPPTAEDQIHIDWIRLLEADSLAFLGTVRQVDDAAMTEAGAGVEAARRLVGVRPRPAARPTMEAFFAKAPDLAAGLPKDEIYPRGQTMGLTFYSVGGGVHPHAADGSQLPARQLDEADRLAAVERVRADGFTMIGPQYELNEFAVADAERAGLKVVYSIAARDEQGKDYSFIHNPPPADVDLEAVKRQITEQVRAVADHESIAWWDIRPEEIRYWYANEVAFVTAVSEAVKAADPLKRPVFMYEPGHRGAASLAKTMAFQDLSAKGTYTNYSGRRDERIFVRWSMEQQVEAIRLAGREDVVPILLPEMFQQPADELLPMIPKWVRHDVYLGLVTGGKGVMTFSMRQRKGFTAHEAYYQAFADVAGELRGELQLAKLFLFGERRDQVWLEVVDGPTTVTLSDNFGAQLGGALEYPSVSWLDAAHPELGRCVVVVNSANEPVKVRVGHLPEGTILAEELLTKQSQTVTGGGYEIALGPLGVAVWRLERGR